MGGCQFNEKALNWKIFATFQIFQKISELGNYAKIYAKYLG